MSDTIDTTINETEFENQESEEAAAAALAELGASAAKSDDESEFLIPQRFTKSGRKRAVPFPLKVRYLRTM